MGEEGEGRQRTLNRTNFTQLGGKERIQTAKLRAAEEDWLHLHQNETAMECANSICISK
jgi:hypothetical protein